MNTVDATIIVGILSLCGTLAGSYFANSKNEAVMQEQIKDIKGDIGTLSARVDKHNNLVERMVVVEQSTKSAHHRIDEVVKGKEV